jgi:hypothetical protein
VLKDGFQKLTPLELLFVYRSETKCTSESVTGQFSIFGATEEKSGHEFSRINTDEGTA